MCEFGAWSELLQTLHRRLPARHWAPVASGAWRLHAYARRSLRDGQAAPGQKGRSISPSQGRHKRRTIRRHRRPDTVLAEGDGGWINARATVEIAKARVQAATNQRISDEREAKRRAHEPSNEPCNEPSSLRSTKGEPIHSHSQIQKPKAEPDPDPKPDPGKGIAASAACVNSKNSTSAPTAEIWKSYSDEYYRRYGIEPVRNRTVNGQLTQVIKRLGAEDAPHVAAYYVRAQRELVSGKRPFRRCASSRLRENQNRVGD